MKTMAFVLALTALGTVGCAAPATVGAQSAGDEAQRPAEPPPGIQWLYGSAEGAVASLQTYAALRDYALPLAQNRPADSVVLAAGASPLAPDFIPCGDRPLAAVFDADETLLLNLGSMRYFAERGIAFDPAIWSQWEQTGAGHAAPVPGAIDLLTSLRDAGITIIVNTNRSSENAEGSEATLAAAGIGEFEHGQTLFLRGDDALGSDKDGRRATISERYCVIALVGDQLGDFSHAFNAEGRGIAERRAMVGNPAVARLWGNGWFLLSNPIYGPSIRGDFDEIFPSESRWEPNHEGTE